MYHSPSSLDINIKNSNNTNTHINFNFNINSGLEKKFLSPTVKSVKDPPASITGRKIEQNNLLNYESSNNKYPILIEESKKKPKSKPLDFTKNMNANQSKSLLKLTNSKQTKNLKAFKSMSRDVKPKELKLQEEKPKLEEEKSKPKLTLKPKKKMKKKNVSLKKKKLFTNKEIGENINNFAHLQEILKSNNKKYHMEKVLTQQRINHQLQNQILRQHSLHLQNQAIRKLNSNSSSNKRQRSMPKFPWGFDQKKFLGFFEKILEANSLKNTRSKMNSLWLDDKTRRERLGLGFLNEMGYEDFEKLVQRQKQEVEPLERSENKKSHKESNPEILNWMNYKKKKIEEAKWSSIKSILEEQQRIRKNMQELEMKVSQTRTSAKPSSYNTNNTRSHYAKSSHYMEKIQMDEGKSNTFKQLGENEENHLYDMIKQEFKEIVYNSKREEINGNQMIGSQVKHIKSKSEDMQGKILQKKRNIQEKFQVLSEKMVKGLGIIKLQSKSPSLSPTSEKMIKNPNEDFTKLKPQNFKKIPEFQNKIKVLSLLNNIDDISKTTSQQNSKKFQEIPKTKKDLPYNNCDKQTPPSKRMNNNNIGENEDVIFEDSPAVEFSSEEEEMIYMINTAATLIQKVWKGFHTRKMMNYYVLLALKEMNPEFPSSPKQLDNEELVSSSKRPSKLLRKSHSLDEIYEPGNLFSGVEEIPHKMENSNKLDGVFNEEEREELNKKLKLVNNNKNMEDFDYYQLGGKLEEIQFDIKASDSMHVQKHLIDNNLFYGKKNENLIETTNNIIADKKIIGGGIEIETLRNQGLEKSVHMTDVSQTNEEINKLSYSDKNIQISNINIGSIQTFLDRRGSIDNEPEELKINEFVKSNKMIDRVLEKNEAIDKKPIKWEEFIDYVKLCSQKNELNEAAQKFLDKLQFFSPSTLDNLTSPSDYKNQEIQTNNFLKNSAEESHLKSQGNEQKKSKIKGNKNLLIEIEDEEQKTNINEEIAKDNFIENKEEINYIPVINTTVSQGDLRRAVGSEKLIRTQSPTSATNKNSTIFELDPFREFTSKKIREFLNKENMLSLIRFREKALSLRHQAQIDLIKSLFDKQRVSPRTFKNKSDEIERWVSLEREDMLRQKMEIEKGWLSAALTMRRTQRDLMFMRKSLGKQGKMELMNFKQSYSEEDFNLFEGLEEKEKAERSILEIKQMNRLEIQDEVLKASNEKNKEHNSMIENLENNQAIFIQNLGLTESCKSPKNDENLNFDLNKQLTTESSKTNSPKILFESFKTPIDSKTPINPINLFSDPFNIPLEFSSKSPSTLLKEKSPSDSKRMSFEERPSSLEYFSSKEIKPLKIEPLDSMKQKIGEIPKFLSQEDFGNLSANSSLSNSKADMPFLSKNREMEKKIEQISGLVLEQLMEEMKNDGKLVEMLKIHKIVTLIPQKSPKVGGFVGGKDIQEHFPPVNSPSREDLIGNKRFKDQIISPKNNIKQYRIKSEPDEKFTKGNQGILSNIEAVKEYSNELIDLIKRKYKDNFLKNINIPLGLIPSQKLKLLQLNLNNDTNSSEGAYENSYMYPAFYKEPILSVEVFTDLEKVLFKKDCLSNKKRIYELQQIHNKAIFDSFNEALDQLRPHGLKGRPSPWKPTPRQAIMKLIDEKNFITVLNKAKEKLLEWSSNLCGFIHDKEESQFLEGVLLDDECLGQIREDRMARMLAQEVIECEDDWVEYGDEETEVGVELGDLIFEKMVLDGIETMLHIKEKRRNNQDV